MAHVKETARNFGNWIRYKKKLISNKVEDIWVENSILISVTFSLMTGYLYYIEAITNMRQTIAHIVVFASIIIGVLGVFLTLIITLKESPVFERIREHFPVIEEKLFVWIRNQMWSGILVVMLSVFISLLKTPDSKILATVGVVIWGTAFWHICFGSFYTIKLITDLILKNVSFPSRKRKI